MKRRERRSGLRSVLGLGVVVVAAASTHAQERRVVDLRVLSVDPMGFRLDVRNVSANRLDYPVRLTVRLTRLDDAKGPGHAHLIWSFIDPASGLYSEVSPLAELPRLVLEPEQVKTIKVQYGELRWFYEYLGTRAPERFTDLAESGEFDLSVWLEFTPGPWPGADVGPIRVSILVRSSMSPDKRMELTRPTQLRSLAAYPQCQADREVGGANDRGSQPTGGAAQASA